ncbi:MAG TPA: pyridoxamine 5'-phosphate oxidase family protein [Solirubrobacterales bacterium]|nr:pyridoxamine 5'-phosphate oxidase family protein [Solirubrobacterales bacterium]
MRTPRTKLRRKPKRGSHEREVVEAILDQALVSHLGFVDDGLPVVIPTLHVRVGSAIYLHGSAASRALRESEGAEVCLTATLVDGLVLARSAMHHSANYRSAVLFGEGRWVDGEEKKLAALEALVEKLAPGRWGDARVPTAKELRATAVLKLPLQEASAKIRTGPPLDEEEDLALPVWAGVVGLRTVVGELEPDPLLAAGVRPPAYLDELLFAQAGSGRDGSNGQP